MILFHLTLKNLGEEVELLQSPENGKRMAGVYLTDELHFDLVAHVLNSRAKTDKQNVFVYAVKIPDDECVIFGWDNFSEAHYIYEFMWNVPINKNPQAMWEVILEHNVKATLVDELYYSPIKKEFISVK